MKDEAYQRDEAMRYIGTLVRDLRRLAVTSDLPFLAYLLGMVESEATNSLEPSKAPSRRREPANSH